eukprot:15484237-Alexandrium_andersonii.AAC.1
MSRADSESAHGSGAPVGSKAQNRGRTTSNPQIRQSANPRNPLLLARQTPGDADRIGQRLKHNDKSMTALQAVCN